MRSAAVRMGAVVGGIFLLDRATKEWARHFLMPRPPVEVAPFFYLSYAENTGAAFGLMKGSNALLTVLSAALIAVMIRVNRRLAGRDRLARFGILLVIAGALGNLFDRLTLGYVVDFLDFRVWPVFNVADSCITAGACCLGLGLRGDQRT